MSTIIHVTDASFEKDVLQSKIPVLVDFWAEWCGPCKQIAKSLEELSQEYAGRVTIAKIDVDANKDIPARFGIRGIPTMIIMKDGIPVAQKVGAAVKGTLQAFVDTNL